MKKINSTGIVILIIMILMIIYCIPTVIKGFYIGGIFPLAPSAKKMEVYFNENMTELSYVAQVLSQMNEYDYIAIRETEGSDIMHISNDEYMPNTDIKIGNVQTDILITDNTLVKNIEKLYAQGFDSIIKEENDHICFSRWSSLDNSRGIAFSMTEQKPNIEFLVNLKPLSKEKWYYYETNYDQH